MPYVHIPDLGNIPGYSTIIYGMVVWQMFRCTTDHSGENSEPTPDAPVNFPSCHGSPPRITRSISCESPLPTEESVEESNFEEPLPAGAFNLGASSEPQPPAGFRSKVTTPAAFEASESRRRSPLKYFCKHCRRGFTRKSNLDQHYQSHLGVPNKLCPFCRQMFMSSISRHKKSCKQNPNRPGVSRPQAEPGGEIN